MTAAPTTVETAGPVASTAASGARDRNNAARLFGYDVFISFALGPPPRGSHSYASDLARQLRERDFTVFFSEDEAAPGAELDGTLLKALKSSRTLVVIANRGTLAEPRWVRKEVEEFRRARHAGLVIPINIGGALQDPALAAPTQAWLEFQDKIWLDEVEEASTTGLASLALVERLATAPTQVRSNVKWRRVVRAVIATLAVMVLALGLTAWVANANDKRARAELRVGTSQRLATEARALIQGIQDGGDERALQQLTVAQSLSPLVQVAGHMQVAIMALAHVDWLVNMGSPVRAVTFTNDGSQILADGDDGLLRRWRATDGQPQGEPARLHEADNYRTLALFADGRFTAEGDLGGDLLLTDRANGKVLARAKDAHYVLVRSPALSFNRDGSRLVSGGSDGMLKLWNTANLRAPLAAPGIEAHGGGVQALALSPDGALVVSGGAKQRAFAGLEPDAAAPVNVPLRLWNASTLQPVADFRAQVGNVESVAFSPDGQRIAVGGEDGTLRLWDVKTRRPIRTLLTGIRDGVRGVAFNQDGSLIALGGGDGTLATVDALRPPPIGFPLAGNGEAYVDNVAFSSDGALVLSADQDGMRRIWNASTGQLLGTLNAKRKPTMSEERVQPGQVPGLAVSPDGKHIAAGQADGNLLLFDAQTRKRLAAFKAPSDAVEQVVFNDDGTEVLAGGADGMLRRWNTRTGKPIGAPVEAHAGTLQSLAYSPDGAQVVTGGQDDMLNLWDAETLDPIASARFEGQAGEPGDGRLDVAFNVGGDRIVSIHTSADGVDRAVQVWDTGLQPVGTLIRREEGGYGIDSVAFSPDGAIMAWGLVNGSIQRWDTLSGQPIGTVLKGHEGGGSVQSLAFSPDGADLVSVGYDGTLRLWDTATGRAIGAPFRGHTGEGGVRSLAFSSDGTRMAAGGVDGTVRLWPGRRVWVDLLCAKLTRNMSRAQWQARVSREIDYLKACPNLPEAQ